MTRQSWNVEVTRMARDPLKRPTPVPESLLTMPDASAARPAPGS
jgi:hypothetical protein